MPIYCGRLTSLLFSNKTIAAFTVHSIHTHSGNWRTVVVVVESGFGTCVCQIWHFNSIQLNFWHRNRLPRDRMNAWAVSCHQMKQKTKNHRNLRKIGKEGKDIFGQSPSQPRKHESTSQQSINLFDTIFKKWTKETRDDSIAQIVFRTVWAITDLIYRLLLLCYCYNCCCCCLLHSNFPFPSNLIHPCKQCIDF